MEELFAAVVMSLVIGLPLTFFFGPIGTLFMGIMLVGGLWTLSPALVLILALALFVFGVRRLESSRQ